MATARPRRVITTSPADQIAEATETLGDLVTVVIPKPFTLTTDNGGHVHYSAGTQEMPTEHAEHWFSRAMGVTVYTPPAQDPAA